MLLGGKRRDTVRVCATGMYFTEGGDLAAKLAREAEGYAAQGFGAMKMKVGHSLAQDVKNVRAVRAAIGPGIALMIDANHAYNRSEARALCRAVEPLEIGWFEEPLSPEDYAGYAELRQQTAIPIAAGEYEYLVHGFKRLLEGQCVDIAQPDACAAGRPDRRYSASLRWCGRTTSILTPHLLGHRHRLHRRVASRLHSRRHPGAPDLTEPLLEMDRTENCLRDRLTRPRFEAKDGAVAVPDTPGLGIDVDPGLLGSLRPPLTNKSTRSPKSSHEIRPQETSTSAVNSREASGGAKRDRPLSRHRGGHRHRRLGRPSRRRGRPRRRRAGLQVLVEDARRATRRGDAPAARARDPRPRQAARGRFLRARQDVGAGGGGRRLADQRARLLRRGDHADARRNSPPTPRARTSTSSFTSRWALSSPTWRGIFRC